jgi:hypothetical protein
MIGYAQLRGSMKVVGGIVAALGILYLLNSTFIYFVRGKISEPEGWANFTAVAAVGVIVSGIGIALFLRKPK